MTFSFTSAEAKKLHDYVRSGLASQRALLDPDNAELVSVLRKLSARVDSMFCKTCWTPGVHARGLCQRCYRQEQRAELRAS